jgi:hypothetical protein
VKELPGCPVLYVHFYHINAGIERPGCNFFHILFLQHPAEKNHKADLGGQEWIIGTMGVGTRHMVALGKFWFYPFLVEEVDDLFQFGADGGQGK